MKILVVDDHPLIQEAAHHVLMQLDNGTVVVEAKTCAEALQAIEQHPDIKLILLDLTLPDVKGYDALDKMRELHPAIPVVVLSANDTRSVVTRALESGAMGFIPKTSPTSVLVNALRLVLSGGVYLPREVLGQPGAPEHAEPTTHATPSDLGLTERQAQVLSLLVQGKPNKIIMRELGLAEATVKVHITSILKALNVDNRTQAVIAVAQRGVKLDRLDAPRKPQSWN